MKLGVISDLHLGDPTTTLVRNQNGTYHRARGFDQLSEAVRAFVKGDGKLDYLVLLGDVFDFSITSWSDAYAAAIPFLTGVKNLADEIIYVPGNHDFSAWDLTMLDTNIIRQIAGLSPTDARGSQSGPVGLKDRWSVPAVLDFRTDKPRLLLSGVKDKAVEPEAKAKYGGLFFDKLGGITFNVAYPNLYIVDKSGRTTLVTHGQYFEGYWSFTSSLGARLFADDLRYASHGPQASIDELVAVNYPLQSLASSGLGMAGPLTPLVRQIQADAKCGRLDRINQYLTRLRNYLDEEVAFDGFGGRVKEFISDKFLQAVVEKTLASLKTAAGPTASPARYNAHFFADPHTRLNIARYLDACILELADIRRQSNKDVPPPSQVLFGHTHVPILQSDVAPRVHHELSGTDVQFWNTGGWLEPKGGKAPAALFTYDSDAAPSWVSQRIAID